MYSAEEMNTSQILRLIKQGEGIDVEFKQSFQEETLQTIGAFANTCGGTILIGVNDNGVIVGTTVGKSTIREIQDKIVSCTDPRVIPEVETAVVKSHTIIVLRVSEYPVKPVSVKGRCYRRVGECNRQMVPVEIAEMHMGSTGASWDARVLEDRTIKDVNLSLVRHYVALARNIGRRNFPKGAKPADIMKKMELIRDGHPTWAAVLLFGKRPQSSFIQATVHCGRFRTAIDITDDRLIVGSIIDQIDETMDFLKKHINVRFVITGKPRRDEIWDYPLEALREAVVNAVCHRDYGSPADIQIKIFDDRIRIWNPGFLLHGLTVESLYQPTHASKLRNKLIAQVFYDLEIIERYGSGIQRILDFCQSAGLPAPTIEECTGGFLITFFKAKASGRLEGHEKGKVTTQSPTQSATQSSDPVVRLLNVLRANAYSSGKLRVELGIKHKPTFRKNYLHPALDGKLIEMTIPGKPNSRLQQYQLTAKGKKFLQSQS